MTWQPTKIICESFEEVQEYLLNSEAIFPLILQGYYYFFQTQISTIYILEIHWGQEGKYLVSLEKGIETLDKLITWLEQKERYEECQYLLQQRDMI